MEKVIWGWRDGSEVKGTVFSFRGPEFNSQQPQGGSQPSVMRSDTLFRCDLKTATVYLQITINKSLKKKKERKKKYAFSWLEPRGRKKLFT